MKKPLKIGILSVSAGAGASFLSVMLANVVLSNKFNPSVLEFGNSRLYDTLGMDKYFDEGEFFPFQKAILQGRSVRDQENLQGGINWCLRSPSEKGFVPDRERKLRLLHSVKGDPVICDLSGTADSTAEREDNWRLLWEMDRVVAVLDPLPSRMLASSEMLSRLRGSFLPVEYVINRWNAGVDKREALSFFQLRDPVILPALDTADIYAAEYGCRSVWSVPSVRRKIEKPMTLLCRRLGLF